MEGFLTSSITALFDRADHMKTGFVIAYDHAVSGMGIKDYFASRMRIYKDGFLLKATPEEAFLMAIILLKKKMHISMQKKLKLDTFTSWACAKKIFAEMKQKLKSLPHDGSFWDLEIDDQPWFAFWKLIRTASSANVFLETAGFQFKSGMECMYKKKIKFLTVASATPEILDAACATSFELLGILFFETFKKGGSSDNLTLKVSMLRAQANHCMNLQRNLLDEKEVLFNSAIDMLSHENPNEVGQRYTRITTNLTESQTLNAMTDFKQTSYRLAEEFRRESKLGDEETSQICLNMVAVFEKVESESIREIIDLRPSILRSFSTLDAHWRADGLLIGIATRFLNFAVRTKREALMKEKI